MLGNHTLVCLRSATFKARPYHCALALTPLFYVFSHCTEIKDYCAFIKIQFYLIIFNFRVEGKIANARKVKFSRHCLFFLLQVECIRGKQFLRDFIIYSVVLLSASHPWNYVFS